VTLLIDINVILDVALERAPFAKDAARLLVSVDRGQAKGYVATHSVTTLFYVVAKNRGADAATRVVSNMLRVLDVVPAGRADLQDAISLGWKDLERCCPGGLRFQDQG
jgi:predicted nucleic acid-binding protein